MFYHSTCNYYCDFLFNVPVPLAGSLAQRRPGNGHVVSPLNSATFHQEISVRDALKHLGKSVIEQIRLITDHKILQQ